MPPFLERILSYTVYDFLLITCLLFLICFRNLNKTEKIAGIYCLIAYASNVASEYIQFNNPDKPNNQWLFNYVMLILHSISYLLYYKTYKISWLRKICAIVYFFYLAFYLINWKFIQGYYVFNSFSITIGNAIVAALAFIYLYQFIKSRDSKPSSDFLFWFSSAILIGSIVTIPVQSTLSWLAFSDTATANKLWLINDVADCSTYSLIIIGLLWTQKFRKSPSSSYSQA